MAKHNFVVNVNANVKVKLTEMGKQIWYNQFVKLNEHYGKKIVEPEYPKVDAEGYTTMQLHALMTLYAPYLNNGGCEQNNTCAYDTEIDFEGEPVQVNDTTTEVTGW